MEFETFKIIDGIHNKMRDCFDEHGKKKEIPTCQLNDHDIENISYFIAHKIPKCEKLNISLANIQSGIIIARGSFGYSFLLTNMMGRKVLIKIIVCNNKKPEYITEKENMLKEIELHLKLTKLDKYNKYLAKIKGYFNNDKISSIFGKKSVYNYYDSETNLITCTLPSKKYSSNCEIYLFMEAGENDLSPWFGNFFTIMQFERMTKLFFDFINCYEISEGILQLEQKIFIHSDIKPENLILFINEHKKEEIKLIDFGLSLLSPTFINYNSSGTEYMYALLFSYGPDKILNKNLLFRSPLFDTFSIIISYLELVLYQYNKINLRRDILSFGEIISHMEVLLSANKKIKEQSVKNCTKLMYLGKLIYDFYQKNIDDYMKSDLNETKKLLTYLSQMKIKNLKITSIDPLDSLPIYDSDKDVDKTELQKDYEYFDKIMKYCLHGNIFKESII